MKSVDEKFMGGLVAIHEEWRDSVGLNIKESNDMNHELEKNAGHTPLVCKIGNYNKARIIFGECDSDWGWAEFDGVDKEKRAERVLTAVNSYPKLVEALKRIVENENHQCNKLSAYCKTNCMWKKAREALKLAGVE